MKISIGLALGGAAIASLCITPTAHAASVAKPSPPNVLTYSAETVTTNGNNVMIPLSVLNWVLDNLGGSTADTVTIFAPPGTTFGALPAGPFFVCSPSVNVPQNDATGFAAPGGSGEVFATAGLGAGNTSIVTTGAWMPLTNSGGTLSPTVCQGGDQVAFVDTPNQGVTLQNVTDLAVPGREVTIYAQYTNATGFRGDSAPFPLATLLSRNTLDFTQRPNSPPLGIDLTGTAGSNPGTQFSNGAGGINVAGFLGTVTLLQLRDLSAASGGPLAATLAGTASFTLTGNFPSMTGAYQVVNATTAAACNGANPGGSVPATSVTATAITIPIALPATFQNGITWAVCVVTATAAGTTQQIQPTAVAISAQASVTGFPNNPIILTAANQPYGAIVNNGSVAFFQNTFGSNNNYPTFFRAANPTGAPAPVFALLSRDGGASFEGPLITFNNNGTNVPFPVPANNASTISADQLALELGTNYPAGGLHATVRLLSPTPTVLFSAISQNSINGAATGDLSSLP
jgi:hypothetical protein